jgi:ribosome-binding protein aMBF1 (putative translation factor)
MSRKESGHSVSRLGQDAKQAAARRRASDTKYSELEKKHEVALAIADLVILHRTRTGLTQEDLASRMMTSVSAISRLESGFHVPSIDTLRKLAGALGGRVKIDIVDIKPQNRVRSPKRRVHARASRHRRR